MSDWMKKVQPGSRLRIPAAAYNAFVDAARAFQQEQQSQEQVNQPAHRSSGIVLVKNASGVDQDRFAVLGVDSPLYGPQDNLESFKNQLVLNTVLPAEEHAGRFVVLLEPLKANAIGRALAGGVGLVRINVTDAAHGFGEVEAGQTLLSSSSSGSALILWKESGTGTKWAIVRLGGGGGGSPIVELEITAIANDYLVCGDVYVAKPPALRHSGYQTVDAQTVDVSDNLYTERWVVTPTYVVGHTIHAIPSATGLADPNNAPITLVDMNIEARVWGLQDAY